MSTAGTSGTPVERVAAGAHFGFARVARQPHDERWRAIDATVARWVLLHGGSALLAEVAAWASFAEGQGDSAVPLQGQEAGRHDMPRFDAARCLALAAEPMVGQPGAGSRDIGTPFVLDGDCFYLRRNWRHETALAAHLHARRAMATGTALAEDHLRALFNGSWSDHEQAQREAVRRVLGKRLFVLTGGPGTGKTTTVLRMLLALARDHAARHGNQAPAIRIAAPTGKAAQRLTDALREGSQRMRERPARLGDESGWQALPDDWMPQLDIALAAASSTLHRLLGSRGRSGGFRHHAGNRLPADIVVIDEASMVDLAMLRAVLEALREDCVLVLVGDAEQLASVGTGSVLLDLVGAMESAGAQDLVRLDHSFRADTTLVPINEAVRRGSLENFRQAWRDAGTARAQWLIVGDQQHLRTRLLAWAARVDAALRAAGAFDTLDGADLRAILGVLRALRQQQLLCALRETGFGAEHVNGVLEDMLRNSNGGASDGDERWYPGRAVMITRNDPPTGLFNGDVGITLRTRNARGEDSLQVWFEASPGAASAGAALPGLRSFNPASLPASEGAFALTVHKSQGSEYQHVAVLLPPDANNPLLSRQMLYTALSRAKASVELWSTEAALEKAIGTIAARSSRLGERLRESSIPRGA